MSETYFATSHGYIDGFCALCAKKQLGKHDTETCEGYTPTREQVRARYVMACANDPVVPDGGDAGAEFDRWHSRELGDADVHTPNPALTLPDPKGGCSCGPWEQGAGGGHIERLLEYDPSCPVHSYHVYNPRAGIWEQVEETHWRPAVLFRGNGKWGVSPWRPEAIEQARSAFPTTEFTLGQVAVKATPNVGAF